MSSTPYFIPADLRPGEPAWQLPGGLKLGTADPDASDLDSKVGLHLYIDSAASKQWATKLPALRNLKYLHLRGRINSMLLEAVGRLENLERLQIGDLRAETLEPLAGLLRLQYLHLTGVSRASGVESLMGLTELVALGLGIGRQITTLDAFEHNQLMSLRSLLLGGSAESVPAKFASLAPLANLARLEYLDAVHVVCDETSLAFLTRMASMKKVCVRHLSDWDSMDLENLKARGIAVQGVRP